MCVCTHDIRDFNILQNFQSTLMWFVLASELIHLKTFLDIMIYYSVGFMEA